MDQLSLNKTKNEKQRRNEERIYNENARKCKAICNHKTIIN